MLSRKIISLILIIYILTESVDAGESIERYKDIPSDLIIYIDRVVKKHSSDYMAIARFNPIEGNGHLEVRALPKNKTDNKIPRCLFINIKGNLEINKPIFGNKMDSIKLIIDSYFTAGPVAYSGSRRPNRPYFAFGIEHPVCLLLVFPDKSCDFNDLLYGSRVPEEHIKDLVEAIRFIKQKCLKSEDWEEEKKNKMNYDIIATNNPFLIYSRKRILKWDNPDAYTDKMEAILHVKGLFQKIVFGQLSCLFSKGEAVRTIRILVESAEIPGDVLGLAWAIWGLRKNTPDNHFDPEEAIKVFVNSFREKKWAGGTEKKFKEIEDLCKELEAYISKERNKGDH